MELSIIIVNWNTRSLLRACLHSVIANLSDTVNHEILVVDNASSDGSAKMVSEEFPAIRLIQNRDNVGFARANNQAVAGASGKYILLLNSDTKMIEDGAREILKYMDANPSVGVATGKMLFEDGEFQPSCRRFPRLLGTAWRNTFGRIVKFNTPFSHRYRYENLDPDKIHQVDWVVGAYLYVRASLIERGKIFDENIFMFYEDTLLCKRIWDSGHTVMYLPLAPVIHYQGQSANKAKSKSILYSFQSSVLYFERLHGSSVAKYYRYSVRLAWCIFGAILRVFPFERFRQKSDLFRYLYHEDSKL